MLRVTWIKQPPGSIPQDYRDVPEVPAPRTFPHEYFFRARLVDPVDPGQEFEVHGEGPAVVAEPAQLAAPAAVGSAVDVTTQASPQAALGPADKLRQPAALRDEGLITGDEFEAKKADLLRDF
jgi:hypothetical protein